jgi:hypothetical protein
MSRGKGWFGRGFMVGFLATTALVLFFAVRQTVFHGGNGEAFVSNFSLPASLLARGLSGFLYDTFALSYFRATYIESVVGSVLGSVQYGLLTGLVAWGGARLFVKSSPPSVNRDQ